MLAHTLSPQTHKHTQSPRENPTQTSPEPSRRVTPVTLQSHTKTLTLTSTPSLEMQTYTDPQRHNQTGLYKLPASPAEPGYAYTQGHTKSHNDTQSYRPFEHTQMLSKSSIDVAHTKSHRDIQMAYTGTHIHKSSPGHTQLDHTLTPRDIHRHPQITHGNAQAGPQLHTRSRRHTFTRAPAVQPLPGRGQAGGRASGGKRSSGGKERAGETCHLQPAGDPPHPSWKPGPGS